MRYSPRFPNFLLPFPVSNDYETFPRNGLKYLSTPRFFLLIPRLCSTYAFNGVALVLRFVSVRRVFGHQSIRIEGSSSPMERHESIFQRKRRSFKNAPNQRWNGVDRSRIGRRRVGGGNLLRKADSVARETDFQ